MRIEGPTAISPSGSCFFLPQARGGFLLAAALFLVCLPSAGFAADEGGLGAAVDFSRYHVDLAYTGAPAETARVDEIGLTLSESFTANFDLALQGGYTSVDFGHHPPDAGFNLTGRFFGVLARYEPRLTAHISLLAQAAYRWHKVDNGQTKQYDELTWYETSARVGPAFRAGFVRAAIGAYYQHFDGDELARGPAFRRDFGAARSTGAFASVRYYFDPTGSVGLVGETGGRRGIALVFSRGF